jgi:hypothetical protein
MKWVATEGRKPRTGDKLLHLKFRNGLESKQPYQVDKIARWTHVGDPWDVIAVARVVGE